MAKSKKADSPATCGPDPKWQAEDDVRTLERAAELEADPARMKAAAKIAEEKQAAMQKVTADLERRGLISGKAKAKMAKKGKKSND